MLKNNPPTNTPYAGQHPLQSFLQVPGVSWAIILALKFMLYYILKGYALKSSKNSRKILAQNLNSENCFPLKNRFFWHFPKITTAFCFCSKRYFLERKNSILWFVKINRKIPQKTYTWKHKPIQIEASTKRHPWVWLALLPGSVLSWTQSCNVCNFEKITIFENQQM